MVCLFKNLHGCYLLVNICWIVCYWLQEAKEIFRRQGWLLIMDITKATEGLPTSDFRLPNILHSTFDFLQNRRMLYYILRLISNCLSLSHETFCCEATRLRSRLIQVAYVTSLGCLCPKPASFETFGCMFVPYLIATNKHLPRITVHPKGRKSQ